MTDKVNREEKNAVFKDGEKQKSPAKSQAPKARPNKMSNPLAELGIEIPDELVPLPSTGKTYPVDSVLHGAECVEIKRMTATEEDILTSRALIKNGTVISRLIKSCMTDKTVDTRELLLGDRNAIMVAIRVTGYGARYDVTIDCPKCNTPIEKTIDLSQLPIKQLTIDPIEVGTNAFKLVLPVTKAEVVFKFLTGADEEAMSVESDRRKKILKTYEEQTVTTQLRYSLLSVNGRTEQGLLAKFAQHCISEDSAFLRKYIDDNEPGVNMRTEIKCPDPDCGCQKEVAIPLGVTFFWPNARE